MRAFRTWPPVTDPAQEGQETPAAAGTPSPFLPTARQTDGRTVLSIAFINGTTAEMSYPSQIALERMPVQPGGNVTIEGEGGSFGSVFLIQHRPVEGEAASGTPGVWHGEPVTRWEAAHVEDLEDVSLRFGPWVAQIQPAEGNSLGTHAARDLLLRNLEGLETENGFLILRGQPPVRVWDEGDFPAEPSLFFGDDIIIDVGCSIGEGAEEYVQDGVTVHRYTDGVAPGKDFIAWCDVDQSFTIGVYKEGLAEDLIGSLTFKGVQRP
jgi:hypothetical protein